MKTLRISQALHFSIFIVLCCLTIIVSSNSTAVECCKLNKTEGNLTNIPTPEILSPKKCKVSTKQVVVLKTFLVASSASLTILLLLACIFFWRRSRKTAQLDEESKIWPGVEEAQKVCRRFTIDEIRAATNNFDPDMKIADGGSGRVYKGYIDNNKESPVAVKVLKTISSHGFRQFWTEVETLLKLRHSHLVSLIGYCDDRRFMIIVYAYMAQGTLRDHLYGTDKTPLSWKQRLEICIGAARGLVYLHTGADHEIIHRDVKTNNILLDENWVAKVSDFGLSRLGPGSPSKSHVTTDVKGTFGYFDPEYFLTKHLTPKSDVYGFGVVLFEVLCGRPPVDTSLEEEEHSLAHWARHHVKSGTLDQIIDENLRGEIVPECLKVYGKIADRCLRSDRNRRPKMAEVLRALEFALRLQEGAAVAEEGIKTSEDHAIESDEKISCWGGRNQVVQRPCRDSLIHSCPTAWQKSKSQKMLLRFLSDKVGLHWATQPTSRALRALCFTCSCTLKHHNGHESMPLSVSTVN